MCRAEISETHVNPEAESEASSCRTKKAEVIPAASTSEDVCPWELGPEPRSRKNSVQLDSGSSSSDISVAVTDVSDRFRRQCGLIQQYTLDGDRMARPGQSGRKLSTATCGVEARRASVSAPLALLKDGEKKTPALAVDDPAGEADTLGASSLTLVPSCSSDTDRTEEVQKTLKKGHSLVKTCSVTGANAPIISVSSVTDDHESIQEVLMVRTEIVDEERDSDGDEGELAEDVELEELIGEKEGATDEVATTSVENVEPCCSSKSQASHPPQQLQLAPLAVPDCESPVSESAPEEEQQEQLEAKSNDVCPWEDE